MVVNACEQLSQQCCFLPPGVLAELDGTGSVNCLDLYWPFSFTLSLLSIFFPSYLLFLLSFLLLPIYLAISNISIFFLHLSTTSGKKKKKRKTCKILLNIFNASPSPPLP